MNDKQEDFMRTALDLAVKSAKKGTGPFGCVVVKDGVVIARGWNEVTKKKDPTAHAEIQAIRRACKKMKQFELRGCDVYTSSYPCPMCLSALYWARPHAVFYLNTKARAADAGFDDVFIEQELKKPNSQRQLPLKQVRIPHAGEAFRIWQKNPKRILY